jgi:hypothetical protein
MAPFRQTTLPAHLKPEYYAGRPSEYDPAFCEAVIEFMAQGYSLTAFAGSIRKSRQAVYEWIGRYPAFGDAVSRARGARVTALETKLLRSRKGAETTAAIFALKNAEPDEWRDVKHTTTEHNVNLKTLSDAELYAIAGQKAPFIDADYSHVETGRGTSTRRSDDEGEIIDG